MTLERQKRLGRRIDRPNSRPRDRKPDYARGRDASCGSGSKRDRNDPSRARLLKFAGYGDDRALNVSWFAGTLANTVSGRVVYHESHDEAGNSHYQEGGQDVYSVRTIVVAVNSADLVGATRRYAEAQPRWFAELVAPPV